MLGIIGLLSVLGCPADANSPLDTDASSSTAAGASTSGNLTTPDTLGSTTDDGTTTGVDETGFGVTTVAETTGITSTGVGDGTTTGEPDGCAMDLLLVVDNSASMEPRLSLLLSAIPQFLEGLEGIDLRVMVTDVDGDPFVGCQPACDPTCYVDGVCDMTNIDCFIACSACPDYDCEAPDPSACDVTLGAGLIAEQGDGNAPCDFASGQRWIDSSEPSLETALACAANVGVVSTAPDELVMEAVTAAIDSMGAASECNAGFLRPEAALGIVVVTDEADEGSAGNVDFWRLELESAQPDVDRIAFGAIIGDAGLPMSVCDAQPGEPPADAPRIRALAETFGDQAAVGSICAPSFVPTLSDFAEVVAGMCG